MSKAGKRTLIGTVVVVGLGAMSVLAVQRGQGGEVEVITGSVQVRDLVEQVSTTGRIEPKTQVDITTDVAGRIIELTVEEGDDVEEGQLLLQIDPARFQASVDQAEAQVLQARATLALRQATYDQAERNAERLTALAGNNYVTTEELERAVTQVDVEARQLEAAEHAVEQAEARLAETEDVLQKTTIRAPMSGRVTRLNVERGETAVVGTMNNPGSLLLTVADMSVVEAVVKVDETDIPGVNIGDRAFVEIDAFPGAQFEGWVSEIGNSSIVPINPASQAGNQAIDFEVRVTLDAPPEAIRPDLSLTADIVTEVREGVLAVPIAALTLRDQGDVEILENENIPANERPDVLRQRDVEGVFVVDGNRVRFQPVSVGIAGQDYFEVTGGVQSGTEIVTGSYQSIRELEDGATIRATREEQEANGTGGAA